MVISPGRSQFVRLANEDSNPSLAAIPALKISAGIHCEGNAGRLMFSLLQAYPAIQLLRRFPICTLPTALSKAPPLQFGICSNDLVFAENALRARRFVHRSLRKRSAWERRHPC